MSGDVRPNLHAWCQRNRDDACETCADFLALLDERDELAAKVARVEALEARWDGVLAEVLADSPSSIITDRSVITFDAQLRELRAALKDQP